MYQETIGGENLAGPEISSAEYYPKQANPSAADQSPFNWEEAALPGAEDFESFDIRETEVYRLSRDPETYEVTVESDVTSQDYKAETSEKDWNLLQQAADPLRGQKVVYVGATFEGGGVAMIRPPLINLQKQEGINAHWAVLEPDEEAFKITKKMHNLQQNMAPEGDEFTDEDQAIHQELGKRNFEHLKEQEFFQDADYYVIDDPQPAAMIPQIREHYPDAKILFRNHIQTDRDLMATPGSQQEKIYKYLHETCGVGGVDTYVAHPVEQFVPYGTPNVASIPPTSDAFEDLNRPLSEQEIEDGLDFFDQEIEKQNLWLRQPDMNGDGIDDQEPLDRDRMRLMLFARFDYAKGKPIGMELQKRTIDKILEGGGDESQFPEYVDAGNGSIDDPDRTKIIGEMLELRREEYGEIKDYIKVIGISHNYSAVNAAMRTNGFSMNPSTAEGFEHRATESIIKGVPAIVSNRGGLPLQVEDGVSGLVLNFDKLDDPDDLEKIDDELERASQFVADCVLYPERYKALQESTQAMAESFSEREISTPANFTRWALAMQGEGSRDWKMDDLAEKYLPPSQIAQTRDLGALALR